MEFRRLISFGRSSFVVSVPKPWVERHRLRKGDVVYIEEQGDMLMLTPKERAKKSEQTRVSIAIDRKPLTVVEAEIIAAYLRKHDWIELQGSELKSRAPEIKRALHDLTGIEIVEQSGTKVIAKDLLDLQEVGMDTLLRRIDMTIRSMLEDSTNPLHEDYSESITHRDGDVNRMVFLAKRVVRSALTDTATQKSIGLSALELLKYWQIVDTLEKVGDAVKRIARGYRSLATKAKHPELEKLRKALVDAYPETMKAYYTKNTELALQMELRAQERTQGLEALKKSKSPAMTELGYHLSDMNARMKDLARCVLN